MEQSKKSVPHPVGVRLFGSIDVLVLILPFKDLTGHAEFRPHFGTEFDFLVLFYRLTSQEKSLAMAASLVVTSPSIGPKCIPGDTVGP